MNLNVICTNQLDFAPKCDNAYEIPSQSGDVLGLKMTDKNEGMSEV